MGIYSSRFKIGQSPLCNQSNNECVLKNKALFKKITFEFWSCVSYHHGSH